MKPLRLIFLGLPGTGKGTQAKIIEKRYAIPHISTGEILRNEIKAATPLGLQVQNLMDNGKLVSDELIIDIFKTRISQPDCTNGFILDGVVRTLPQAQAVDKVLASLHTPINKVIKIEADDESLVERLSGRMACGNCGANYHVTYNPPKVAGVCDVCGHIEFTCRPDDQPDVVRARLKVQREQIAPLLPYYEAQGLLVKINGMDDIEHVNTRIAQELNKIV